MRTSDPIPLILGSGSPRRLELVSRFWDDKDIRVIVPSFDEAARMPDILTPTDIVPTLTSRELAGRLAEGKMDALAQQHRLPQRYVALTADTLVVLDDQVMGKPKDRDDALRMLNRLSGRTHKVTTGICLVAACDGDRFRQVAVEVTKVRFARLDDRQMQWYVQSGEPMDKAGAYAIQGFGASLVRRIEGCYYNVMGLPVGRLMVMLQHAADHFSSIAQFNHLLPWNGSILHGRMNAGQS